MRHLIPLQRVYETEALVAFHHPHPAYPLHIVILPKHPIRGLEAVQRSDQDFVCDLFKCVAALADELGLETFGYRLIANGGRYQEVSQLHFHLISEDPSADFTQSRYFP